MRPGHPQVIARAEHSGSGCAWISSGRLPELQYWLGTEFAHRSLVPVKLQDLVEWRYGLLDEDDGTIGPHGHDRRLRDGERSSRPG